MKNLSNILFVLLVMLICTTCKKDEEVTITRFSVSQKADAFQTTAKVTADIDCNTVFSGVEILYDTLISCDNGNILSMEKGDLDNQYNAILKDLVPNKTYYVKYKIFNKINYLYSNKIEKFKTLECTVPMVSTDSIKMMSDASYKVYSHIISDGGLKISEQGVCFGKTKMPTIQNANKALGTKDTTYICTISNLDFNTTYYFRSYAINSLGISYGDEMEYATAEEKLEVSPLSKIFDSNGGTFDVVVTSNSAWTASSNQSWCTSSKTSGSGNESFKITVASTIGTTSGNAIVSIRTKSGIQKDVEIKINTPYVGTVTDCQGHSYPIVKIGEQYWMAENLQCTEYDNGSEAYKSGICQLEASEEEKYAPYYVDGRSIITSFSRNLTTEQRKHLGLHYNWAAAMGYTESEAKGQQGNYDGRRQGICPNGWHLPSKAEFDILAKAIGGVESKDYDGVYQNVGNKLKSMGGWYRDGNGTDDYGFCGLPAGQTIEYMGVHLVLWSSDADWGYCAYGLDLYCEDAKLYTHSGGPRGCGMSVRCVKD